MQPQLIRKNRYQVGDYIVQKYANRWRIVPLKERRLGCIYRADDAVHQATSLQGALAWLAAH